MKQQLDKLWLRTDLFIPDIDLKTKVLTNLYFLSEDFLSFISNFEEFDSIPSFDKLFLTENFFDYLKLVKNELKIVLKDIETTEQLTGLFTGLLGHEMNFGLKNDNYLTSSYEKKEFIMLNSLKLLSIAYQEQFGMSLPLPDDYVDWLDENSFIWESVVKDLN